jgi:hypothetical protein
MFRASLSSLFSGKSGRKNSLSNYFSFITYSEKHARVRILVKKNLKKKNVAFCDGTGSELCEWTASLTLFSPYT